MSEEINQNKNEEMKELVLARIGIMPSHYKLSVGDKGTFTKEEIVSHIKQEDEIGKQVIDMQINFIKALTSGRLLEALNK